MALFEIVDECRPAWVVAECMAEAVAKWRSAVGRESDGEDQGEPKCVQRVCDDDELIVGTDWEANRCGQT